MQSRIKLHYFNTQPNFGDLLNEDLVQKISGRPVDYSSIEDCQMVAIGSLLERFTVSPMKIHKILVSRVKKPTIVWGTGFIKPEFRKMSFLRRLDVRAVRGYYSLERLKTRAGVLINKDVVVGDPGLLASTLVDTSQIEKKYSLGIIPHYVDKENSLLKKISIKNSVVLDITQSPEIFLRKLAECENVISSAMHGLIAADSLGIPNIRMVLGDKIVGGDYKFNDYYSVFNITDHQRINLKERSFNEEDLSLLKSSYRISKNQVLDIQDALLKSFPHDCTKLI